jgi:protease-4
LRGLEPNAIDDYINNISRNLSKYSGNVAEMALNHGLVDSLKTRAEMNREMMILVGEDKAKRTYNHIRLDDYLEIIHPDISTTDPDKDTVGVIIAQGMILDGTQPAGKIGGDSIARLLNRVRRDDNIKAVVLRIDSGGGSPLASEVIRREVEMTRNAGKPVVVSMGSTAASGGYWLAVAADEIWAAPTTITGSIGIFGALATFEKSLDFLGIQSDGVGTTRLADAFDPGRPLNPLLADTLQLIVEEGYRRFIHQVAEGRNMALEEVEKIAQGRVWSGKTALEIGLVDNLGNLQDAVQSAASLAGLDQYQTEYIEQPLTTKERLVKSLKRLILSTVEDHIDYSAFPATRLISTFENEVRQLLLLNDPHGVYAYCLVCDGP